MINIKIIKNLNSTFDKKVIHLSNSLNSNSFFILDDETKIESIKLSKIIKKIQSYGYQVKVITMEEISKKVIDYLMKELIEDFDSVILLGVGGLRFFNFFRNLSIFKNKRIIELKWSRSWDGDNASFFETNIDKFNIRNERIIIFEDVIASGETILNINSFLKKNNNKIISIITCLMQETSPMYSNSFCNTIVGNVINKSTSTELDPFWYPPIYSLRHLLYGDIEMSKFYKNLNERYFNNEKSVEKLIKEMR